MTSDLLIIQELLKRANILTITRYFKVIRFKFPDGVKDAGEMTREQIKRSVRKARKKVNEIKN